jgi:hypothetical protein
MGTATTTPAGRAVQISTGAEALLKENETSRRARLQAAAKRAADTLTPLDAPLFDEAPAAAPTKPAKPTRPTTLADAAPYLLRPFARADVELKPTATNSDKSRALASPYADMRVYFARLDQICGVENWSHTITLSERGAVCALTIFGVTKSAAGDYPIDRSDENVATSAESQAFKRACVAFGLGRYLYQFPQTWAAYDSQKKQFIDPAGVVAQMYAALPKSEE